MISSKEQLSKNSTLLNEIALTFQFTENDREIQFINERIANPKSFVMMLGETGCGKSTLLNGLLQMPYLPVSSVPTTGEIVEIREDNSIHDLCCFGITHSSENVPLTYDEFRRYVQEKNNEYQRLAVSVPSFSYTLSGMSMFDAPGYGSIHEQHEELLKEFIPQSDCLIYVVSYRSGLKVDDADFIRYLSDIKDSLTSVLLVINRVPARANYEDARVREIITYFSELNNASPACYLVEATKSADNSGAVLPEAVSLWQGLCQVLHRPERTLSVNRGLLLLQYKILLSFQTRLLEMKLDAEQVNELREAAAVTSKKKQEILQLINNEFGQINEEIPVRLQQARKRILTEINDEIEKNGVWTQKIECVGFIKAHLLGFLNQREIDLIRDYIELRVTQLNDTIGELLNTALSDYLERIDYIDFRFRENAMKYGKSKADKIVTNILTNFFAKFGGKGGVKAGIPNAAKMGLKKLGDLFGKTFKRETHNALAMFLKKIGANSAKALGIAVAILTETLFYVGDVATWKSFLRNQVVKSIDKWQEEVNNSIHDNLNSLEIHNIEFISMFFSEFESENTYPSDEAYSNDIIDSTLVKLENTIHETLTIFEDK